MTTNIFKCLFDSLLKPEVYYYSKLKKIDAKYVLIWGIGDIGARTIQYLQQKNVSTNSKIYFEAIDKRVDYQRCHINGVLVNGKESISKSYFSKFDCIVICSNVFLDEILLEIKNVIEIDTINIIYLRQRYTSLSKFSNEIQSYLNILHLKKEPNICYSIVVNGKTYQNLDGVIADVNRYEYLYIEHTNGGGTNHFSKLKLKTIKNYGYMHLSYVNNEYHINAYKGSNCKTITFSTIQYLFQFLIKCDFTKIMVANLFGFANISMIINFIEVYKRKKNNLCELTLYTHDFFSVCPSYALISTDDVFCDLPKKKVCHRCYKSNSNILTLYKNEFKDIAIWREVWQKLYGICDKVICFSFSSSDILRRSYILNSDIQVIPHSMEYFRKIHQCNIPITQTPTNKTIIVGIFGNINVLKGKHKILELAATIKQHNELIKIKIFGSIPDNIYTNVISEVGSYTHKNLIDRIKEESIDIVFFPSVCPETFSYTVSEIIMIGLPIICYNLGAQAEKINNYEKGYVIDLFASPQNLLQTIRES